MTDDKRMEFLKSTVRAVAKYGMKDFSTRSISSDAGMNDAYIYRFFRDKEDLLKQAYLQENDQYLHYVMRCIDQIREQASKLSLADRFRLVIHRAWRYLIDTPDVCRFFVYYYHSPNFEKYAQEAYREQLGVLADKVLYLFENVADAKQCMYTLISLLNSFALQVVSGDVADDADAEELVFKVALNAISVQMKKAPEDDCGK